MDIHIRRSETSRPTWDEQTKNNPSEEHWLSMNLDFQKGVVKESAIEWAQAVANRDNRPYFVEEDGGMVCYNKQNASKNRPC